ncbi:MAG: SDR family NAD(P)-dependent oxidoreductase, partial [Chloroflexota bacterium]|nr:SDR family NAD(P)-dependent oxidoreductase [Chloroflexota bacterium]
MFRLDDKTALVTGAGSGIGREIALLFAKQGARVAVADINDAGAEAVVREIRQADGEAFAVHLDVSDMQSAMAAVALAVETTSSLD